MPKVIEAPSIIPVPGNKQIREYVGRVNSGSRDISIAQMTSPAGWNEPGQKPEFREFTLVLRGQIKVEHEDGTLDIKAGQALICEPGEWVRYSTPYHEGAEYIAICVPAFEINAAHRDPE